MNELVQKRLAEELSHYVGTNVTNIIKETDYIIVSFLAACRISLIVIVQFECCFLTVIDSIVLSCLVLYNYGLTIVVLKKHLI